MGWTFLHPEFTLRQRKAPQPIKTWDVLGGGMVLVVTDSGEAG